MLLYIVFLYCNADFCNYDVIVFRSDFHPAGPFLKGSVTRMHDLPLIKTFLFIFLSVAVACISSDTSEQNARLGNIWVTNRPPAGMPKKRAGLHSAAVSPTNTPQHKS